MTTSRFLRSRGCTNSPGLDISLPQRIILFLTHVSESALVSSNCPSLTVECVWNLMAHGDAREGKWRGNWRMEWVASTLILPRKVVYPALLTLMRTPRLPAVDWTDVPADLNGLVRFSERPNLVSARVPSHFKRTITKRNCMESDSSVRIVNRRSAGQHTKQISIAGKGYTCISDNYRKNVY